MKNSPSTGNTTKWTAAYRVKDLNALIPGLTDTFGNQNEKINTEVIEKEEKISEKLTNV